MKRKEKFNMRYREKIDNPADYFVEIRKPEWE